jgi:hypothetical protein
MKPEKVERKKRGNSCKTNTVPEQPKNINQRTLKINETKFLALNVYVHFIMKAGSTTGQYFKYLP